MNILVTGANGQLGHEMQRVALGSNHHYIFTDVADGYEQLDITNLDAIRAMVKDCQLCSLYQRRQSRKRLRLCQSA